MRIEFTSMKEKTPPYGVPLLIRIKGTVQYITYVLDCGDDEEDWFEPFYFGSDDELKILKHKVDEWALLSD